MFDTVLVANRGEIALRVMRACKELGLRTVAVYSEADRDAPHVAYADDAFLIGPPAPGQSYLNIERIIEVAQKAGVGAIHPGYGFLSENASFARACEEAGITFVGPLGRTMERMGAKDAARREATNAGVPIVPGTLEAVNTPEQVRKLAEEYGYPVAIKAIGGGGGRGLRVVYTPDEVKDGFDSARRESEAAFKNPELYVEKYLTNPRHIEIQILADTHGNVVYLGERDCSIQRRHQKLIEESPSPAITPEIRTRMGESAVSLAKSVDYRGAGTLEFLFQDGEFYFLEMNTRIQVEHTVTEMVTNVDLVQGQLRVAQGETLWLTQDQIVPKGHAIECRINAEDPAVGFRPALGTIDEYIEPVGFGVRVDSGVRPNYAIPQYYDSLIAKLVVWADTREAAIARTLRALEDYRITGVITTIPFHQMALAHKAFADGEATVNFIPRYLAEDLPRLQVSDNHLLATNHQVPPDVRLFAVEVNGRRFDVRVASTDTDMKKNGDDRPKRSRSSRLIAPTDGVVCPIQGTVIAVRVERGQAVEAGQVLFLIEAMKMENEITAPHAGVISEIATEKGQVVEAGALLASYQTE
ncbi:MAG: acetyl-CoA carboxylase biotin carboxylase subunit [Chloroflexi bacterium AL-W]|nr:acetyl-CoA carboxylase biotin carboxylase subunit [Chloroflexi bacterium AL-W]